MAANNVITMKTCAGMGAAGGHRRGGPVTGDNGMASVEAIRLVSLELDNASPINKMKFNLIRQRQA